MILKFHELGMGRGTFPPSSSGVKALCQPHASGRELGPSLVKPLAPEHPTSNRSGRSRADASLTATYQLAALKPRVQRDFTWKQTPWPPSIMRSLFWKEDV